MKTATALCLIGGGAIWLMGQQRKVEALKYMDITVSKIKPNLSNILSPGARVTLNVFNPNGVPVVVDTMFGEVTYQGGRLASYNTTAPVRLDKGGRVSVDVDLRINALNLITMIKNAALFNMRYTLDVSGIARTAVYDQSFKKTIQL